MYPENIWTFWDSSQLLVKPIQTGEDFSAKIKSVFVPASLAGLLAFFEIWQEREIVSPNQFIALVIFNQ